jgi:hypothetical protein
MICSIPTACHREPPFDYASWPGQDGQGKLRGDAIPKPQVGDCHVAEFILNLLKGSSQ